MTLSKLVTITGFIALIGLSACSNTFEGAGRDMEQTGQWIQDRF